MTPEELLDKKLNGLRYCLELAHYEDAAAHLCDLLGLCRQNIGDGKTLKDLQAMVACYGNDRGFAALCSRKGQ